MPSNYKTVINFRDGIQVDTDDLISNNGLVGIGSTIPRQQLDVRGNVIVSDVAEFNNVKVTGVTTFFNVVNVASGSSVGIGTTIPEEAFQVGVGSEGATISLAGIITAQKFVGDGSELTGIPASVWVNPGAGNSIYSVKTVGIGTTLTRDNAGFGVGYEIYMDPVAGVGTFEGVVTKNLTVTNTTGQGQGNVNADVGTFSTVTATSSVTAPQFIGTVTDAAKSNVAAGLTDTPNIAVNYIAGVGGTFTGITSFSTLQIAGGIVANGGIITATTFAGTASTAVGAQTAYSLLGDPSIRVDEVIVNGTSESIIKGTGVSTIGQNLNIKEFLGVGATVAASGESAGFIGTVRVHDGDLILGGSISIGGSLVGSVELGSTQNINVLNVGAGLSVAGISTFTGTVTGGADFNISGNVTAQEIDALDSSNIGGGQTIGSGLVVGAAVTGSSIKIENGGGLIIGSGITMAGKIVGVTSIIATGAVHAGDIIGNDIRGTNSNFAGISTLGQANCTSLDVGGSLNVTGVGTITTGKIKIDGASGITSSVSFYSPTGISTFANILVTSGQDTRIFGKYIGINTATPVITEGLEIYSPTAELFVDNNSSGIGIGSTSGDRSDDAKFYVGYDRTTAGALENVTSIFECGTIGIGTTVASPSSNGEEKVEIYRSIALNGGHLGMGGTVGVGTTTISVGFNTDQPGGALDMRYAGGALCLPIANTTQGGSPIAYFHSDGEHIGNMWFDRAEMKVRVAMGQGDGNFIGLRTETYGKFIDDYIGVRGWKGPIVNDANHRDTSPSIVPAKPVEEPVGWGTANVCYHLPTNQFQHKDSAGTWISHVGSATTGVEFIINGTTAILNVVGVGSISLGTLS